MQQRHTLHVVRHREEVEGPDRGERIAVLGEDRDVAAQRGGVAGDVRHCAGATVDDLLDDGALGSLTGRVSRCRLLQPPEP